jgi:signal transduction histidine kinase
MARHLCLRHDAGVEPDHHHDDDVRRLGDHDDHDGRPRDRPVTDPLDVDRSHRRIGSATRLAGFLALPLAAVLAVSVFETVRAFDEQSLSSTQRNLVAELESLTIALGQRGQQSIPSATVAYLRGRVLPQGEVVMVGLAPGLRYGSAGSASLLRSPVVHALLSHPPRGTATARALLSGVDTAYVVAPIRSGSRTIGTVVVAENLANQRANETRVLELVIGEAVVALVAAVTGAYLLLRRLLRTVGNITTTASAIENGELDRRLGDQGTDDEVGQLAATFDSMLDRLDDAMTVQRRLLSDVSHQLRTPLTVAKGHLEVLARQQRADMTEVRETVAIVVEELDHMSSLVERLLMLGRALEPDFLQLESLDLRTFLSDLFDSARVLADRRWLLSDVPDLLLNVDVAKLRGALLNLIDNALRATGDEDTIRISARRHGSAGGLELSVEDSGPGIPPAEWARVLERFGRLGAADREGSGLGLAIVTAVAEAHGGTFDLETSELGGCRAVITLPADRVMATDPRVRTAV